MSKKIGPRVAIVTLKQLGFNCWLPARFIPGVRCARVEACNYLEKNTCRAVDAELKHLFDEARELISRIRAKAVKLLAEKGL
jgi:hypothetical protein